MRTNKLRETLRSGKIALGTCVDNYSPAIVEVAGYSGLDFVRIDTEYSWRSDDSLEHMIRAAEIADITAMVRIYKGNPYLASKVLQAGAGAILVSDIENYQEAVDVVHASKFAPKGVRGYSSFSFSAKWGTGGGKEWVEWSDSEIMVGVMVENTRIMKDLDKIFAIDGLDYCLFGPADFAMSLGYRGPAKSDHKIQEAFVKTCEIAANHNKIVAIGIGQPWAEDAQKYLKVGCKMLELGHDLGILQSVWSKAVKDFAAAEK
jgi:2-keto-3-deoxy-L-rhamnonate aldolase RhmA